MIDFYFQHKILVTALMALPLIVVSFVLISTVSQHKALADCYENSVNTAVDTGTCQDTSYAAQANAYCNEYPGFEGFDWFTPGTITVVTSQPDTQVELSNLVCDIGGTQDFSDDEQLVENDYIVNSNGTYTDDGVISLGGTGYGMTYYSCLPGPPSGYTGTWGCVPGYGNDMGNIPPNGWVYKETTVETVNSDFTVGGNIEIGLYGYAYYAVAGGGSGYTNSITAGIYINIIIDNAAPVIINVAGSPSCSAEDISVIVEDSDWTGSSPPPSGPPPGNYISYTIDGGPPTFTNSLTTINMSGYDQLASHTVQITAEDLDSNGNAVFGVFPPAVDNIVYGPCYTATCGALSQTGLAAPGGGNFSVTTPMTYSPLSGAGPNPSDSNTTLYNYFPSPPTAGLPVSANNTNTLTSTYPAPPTAADTTVYWYMQDNSSGGARFPSSGYCTGTISLGFQPYFSVSGGNVIANNPTYACGAAAGALPSGIIAWNNNSGPQYLGAGTNLAAFAVGNINGFASAQAPMGASSNSPPGGPTGLSFSNADISNIGTGTEYGGDFCGNAPPTPITTTGTGTPQTFSSSNVDISTLPNGNNVYTGAGTLTLTDSAALQPGQDITIIVNNANVYIDSNLTYDNTAGFSISAGGLPQIAQLDLAVSGGNIYIDPSVTQLDGVYQATAIAGSNGAIYDCSNQNGLYGDAGVNNTGVSNCAHQLVVNGSFIAQQVKLERSYGSENGGNGSASPAPAEVFNYSPLAWLGLSTIPSQTYTSISSLPPVL